MKADELLNRKHPIYFPVYAGGVITFMDKYNHDYKLMREKYNNFPKSFRIWIENEPDQYYYYPYALFSAFHNKGMDAKADYYMDKDEMLLFGDSGGFQIATGKAGNSWTREKHLAWAEKNASITPILDTPMSTPGMTVDKAIEKSLESAKYIAENRDTSNTLRVLNVTSGTNYAIMRQWIDTLSIYPFEGWAHGGGLDGKIDEYIYPVLYLMTKRIYSENMEKPLIHHVFGTSRPQSFVCISFLQHKMNKLGIPVQFTFDSSVASTLIKTASYIVNFSMRGIDKFSMSKRDAAIKESYKALQASGVHLACDCPVCKTITELADIVDDKNYVDYYLFYWMHNVYMQVRFKNHIDFIIDTDSYTVYEEMWGKPMAKAFKLVETMLEHPGKVINDQANYLMKELKEYSDQVVNTGKKRKSNYQGTSLTDFFNE